MAIDNVLGSGGYSGGFLGNLTSGLQAIQMTEIQRRINDIQQQKAWDRDDRLRNEKFALEMALPKIAQDRRLALANETAKKVSDYNKQLVEFSKVADSGARMSDEERMKKQLELITARNALVQESEQAKAFIDSLDEARKFHLQTLQKIDPTKRDAYLKQWADLYAKMNNVSTSKDLSPYDVMMAIQPPAEDPYKTYEDVDKAIKDSAVNVYTDKGLKEIIAAKIKPRTNALLGIGVPSGDFNNEQEMLDFFYERNKGLKDRMPTGSGGGLGYGLSNTALDFEPEQVTIANKDYNLVNTPTTVPQSARSYALRGAVNLTTKEQTKKLDNAQVIGVDVDQNKILFKSGGGLAKVGDELALFREGDRPSFYQGKWENGVPMSDLDKESVQKTKLIRAFEQNNPDEDAPSEIRNIRPEKTEDGVTLKGDAVVKGGWFSKDKTIPVSVTYKTARDPRPESFYEAPLSENKSAVANWISKVAINGKPLGQYFEEYKKQTKKPKMVKQKGVTFKLNKTTGEYEPI